jgi:HK97 family phage prohead protease
MRDELAKKLSKLLGEGKFETKEVSAHTRRADGLALPSSVAVKAITGRSVTGIAAVFGNVDSGSDRIHPGAFAKTIAEGQGRQKHFWSHNMWEPPIAIITELKEVGRADLPAAVLDYAPEASGGLQVTREYLTFDLAEAVFENIVKGQMEMSIGYDPLKMSFTVEGEGDTQRRIRELTEIRLWETSDVNFGMNGATVADMSKADLPLEEIAQALAGLTQDIKAGRRNANADLKLINAIHSASLALGCDECAGIATADDGEKSRAETHVSLTPLLSRLQALELSLLN